MFLEIFLRMFADCTLLFGLLGSVPSLLPYSYPLLLAAVICALSAALSLFLQDKKKQLLGHCCGILPAVSLLLAGSPMEMLVLIVPLLYTAYICWRGELHQEYYGYRRFFARSFVILLALWVAIAFVTYFEDPMDKVEDIVKTGIIIRYAIIYFLCGVVLQRQLRLGAHGGGQGEWGQLGGIVVGLGTVLTGFALSATQLKGNVQQILRDLFVVILLPFTLLFDFVEHMAGKVSEMHRSEEYIEQQEATGQDSIFEIWENIRQFRERYMPAETETEVFHNPWLTIIVIAAVAALIALMVVAFSKYRTYSTAEIGTGSAKAENKKRNAVNRLSNRNKVRQTYREFLRGEKIRGVRITKQYTTEDILRRTSEGTDRENAAALREVYLRARYDEKHEVNRAQVSAARDAFKHIRKY